ncbi:putative GDSL lipase/esterase, SGNH hydrolase superfamily [Helianthus annuus]|nr:putative GDSL lipase/esterase, SGNH hydrolase superfamily [Helianthus annuus]
MAQVLKLIHDTGVRRVLVTSLQPVGCLPRETVVSSYKQCNESRNTAASYHNQLLQQAVTTLNNNTKDSSFLILDIFSAFNTALKSKKDFRGIILDHSHLCLSSTFRCSNAQTVLASLAYVMSKKPNPLSCICIPLFLVAYTCKLVYFLSNV